MSGMLSGCYRVRLNGKYKIIKEGDGGAMAATPDEIKLWMTLSALFVDNNVDFAGIARDVSKYSMDELEFAVLYRVGPVCVWNMVVTPPPIWWWFEEEDVIPEIEALIEKRARRGVWGLVCSKWTAMWMRLFCFTEWKLLKAELLKIEQSNLTG
ncbi:hypothetical protein ACIPL1_09855 [Pseudomonas sp. NPDC090202]|uniref:DUF7079 family protein n=1 Tax=unclassified Pseudomonas TaxID=196821 RepID=UPI0037FDE32E